MRSAHLGELRLPGLVVAVAPVVALAALPQRPDQVNAIVEALGPAFQIAHLPRRWQVVDDRAETDCEDGPATG
jgi:hypothetical protein